MIILSNNKKKPSEIQEWNPPVDIIKNQIMESYQDEVVEDQLENNRAIHTFNNQKK